MKFTLAVTCLNEMRSLPRWRQDLERQTRQPDEIVIVDAESTDGTTEALREWAEQDPRVKLRVEKCNAARGHNLGNDMAAHEHIVSTDMGVRLDPHWFEEIVRPFEADPTVEIVAGSYAVDMDSVKGPAARAEYYMEGDGIPKLGPGFVPGNRSMAYTKKVWRELGGLPEDLTLYADDSVFGRQMIQAGYKMAYASGALVYWSRPARLVDFWKEHYRYGKGDGEAGIKTPAAFRYYKKGVIPGWLVPPLTAVRTLQKMIGRTRIREALRKGDLVGLAYVPLLLWGCGWSFGRGYLVGDKRGEVHCQSCRARLKERIMSNNDVR
jgi:cellulose synthase/poly-beta-1,6-N-acetylglucosamine synthase-like glycosyltransferase